MAVSRKFYIKLWILKLQIIIRNKKRRNWITNEVKFACSKKQRLLNIFLQSKSHEFKKQYNLQNNKTKTLVRNAKKNYYEKVYDKQNDSNGKSFCRYLNQICHPNTKRNLEITNTIDSATLNIFFVNIGPSLATKIEKPYNGNMINRVVDSFFETGPKQRSEVQNKAACWEKKIRLYGFNKTSSKNNQSSHKWIPHRCFQQNHR